MTRVCLVGKSDVDLRVDLLSYETARRALSTYAPEQPWANTLCVETISLGAAVSLLNDLNWYLVRLADDAFVLEPSVSGEEWLSRPLATAIRNERIRPAETGDLLKVYGVAPAADPEATEGDGGGPTESGDPDASGPSDPSDWTGSLPTDAVDDVDPGTTPGDAGPPRLTEPMWVQRVTDETPEYDLEPAIDTVVVRVTAEEFGG